MNTINSIQTATTGRQGRTHGLHVVGMAEDLAVRTIRTVQTVRGHRDLVDQLTRAIESVALNLAEGSGRAGRDRIYHYTVAYGSAGESATAVRLLAAYGVIPNEQADELLGRIDNVRAVCWRLSRR
ncbi:MAG TPA: four helix bundle protein [Myxococcota bacterium]|nr:four helix bundle protein [Myxococcota bacterium]HNZ04625.1 four helix bundle protein [Myxococcota bacterium]HPB51356.1 four helix bundle protein [Myxococcota bacterium]HQP96686.1 four helix bundle protein [Myxococcota bacterium]